MQLINDFEKIMVKSPGRELSSAFGTSKDREVKIWEGWLDSMGSGITIGKTIFWGSSTILIWTIVRVAKMIHMDNKGCNSQ